MGWFFTYNQSRSDLIKELTESETNGSGTIRCLRHCTKGNVLWSVWEAAPSDGRLPYRYIRCDLLSRGSGDGWGHKPMSEEMHPYYYSCPPGYLDMAPVANAEWRERVLAWHAARNRKVEVGDVLVFEGLSIPEARIIEKRGRRLVGEYAGIAYNIPPKLLTRVVEQRRLKEKENVVD